MESETESVPVSVLVRVMESETESVPVRCYLTPCPMILKFT